MTVMDREVGQPGAPADDAELVPDEETLELLYEHAAAGPTRQNETVEAIDAKAVQVFSAASVVLGLGAFITTQLEPLAAALYG
jgi:hypothetical protein